MDDFWIVFLKVIEYICNISFWLVVATLAYNIFLIFSGIPHNKRLDAISRKMIKPKTRFAILISARNEQAVIKYLIRSLKNMDYPADLFDIYVIADNCSDQTGTIARAEGANVFYRNEPQRATKGYALNWFFSINLQQFLRKYDHCLIFDADNLVEPDFLTIMDRHIQSGQTVLVGYRDSKNPTTNAISAANSLFWLNQSRYLHQARTNLGLSLTSVSGTGFCFDLQLIKSTGWQTKSLTEDIEFTMQIILKGQKAVFIRDAIFYDEQTCEYKAMIRQRFRWGVGFVQTMRSEAGNLLKYAFKTNLEALDAFWFLAQVPFLFISGLLSMTKMIIQLPTYVNNLSLLGHDLIIPISAYVGMILSLFLLVKLEKKKLQTYFKGILAYPFLGIIWATEQMFALFCKDAVWHPIKHTQGVDIKFLK